MMVRTLFACGMGFKPETLRIAGYQPAARRGAILRIAIAAMIALLVPLAQNTTHAQTLPANWLQLPPDQFAAAADEFFASSDADAAQAREAVAHAWQTFLTDATFVNTGDWDTVEQLMNLFIPRRGLLVTGDTYAAREAAQQQSDQDLAALEGRVTARLAGDLQLVTNSSFTELRTLDSALEGSGVSKADRAEHFAAWMAANDWQSLDLAEQGVLLAGLDADRVERWNMSIRWTGFITAPRTDEYTFSQLAHYREDAVMKVWVNEQQVLDSTPESGAGFQPANSDRFTSTPVRLTANQPAAIHIELTHNVPRSSMTDNTAYPMAVLLWQASADADQEPQIVPASALSPPAGVAGQAALQGEYFNGAKFDQGQLVATRLDGPIDFIWPGLDDLWSWRQVVPVHEPEFDGISAAATGRLTAANYLENIAAADLQQDLMSGGRHALGAARASERIEFLDRLLAQSDKLAALDTHLVGRIVKHTYMLPGDRHVRLIGEWAARREQPRTQLGSMFGWGPGTYEGHNLEYYWHIGHFFSESYRAHLDDLLDDRLEQPNGDCNLHIAYIAAWAQAEEGWPTPPSEDGQTSQEAAPTFLIDRINEALSDESLAGDARMTWLLAQVYAQNVMTGGEPEPLQGIDQLQEAMLVASAHDRKFWALQEMVARLGSWDAGQSAKSLFDQFADTFDAPSEQAAINQWRTRIDELAQTYESTRPDREQAQRVRQQEEHIAALRKRLARAETRGDSDRADQYRQLIQTFSNESLDD